MSNVFARIFGFGSDNSAELQAANARISELETQGPVIETVTETVEVEVLVPQEMVSIVVVQLQHKATSVTAEQYAAYAGMLVREFVSQMFPDADLTRISQISLVSTTGGNATLALDDTMPAEVPASIGISQTSGRGE
jgi:hypothetical protein